MTFDDCTTSLVINAMDWEGGCRNGGTKITCRGGTAGRWDKVNSDADRTNWRVGKGYIGGAEKPTFTDHLKWPTASKATGGHAQPAMCGEGNKWTFRRDMAGAAKADGTNGTHNASVVLSVSDSRVCPFRPVCLPPPLPPPLLASLASYSLSFSPDPGCDLTSG